MSKNDPPIFDSSDSVEYADGPSPINNPDALPAGATVLEEAIEENQFQNGACSVHCPGCAEHLETYSEGLPEVFTHFAAQCEECEASIRRWSAVLVPGKSIPPFSHNELQEIVQSYWEEQFRQGVETDGLPHTREFGDECERLADKWGWGWEVSCPLCSRSLTELGSNHLGYHHWSYEPDVGTSLCTPCHDYIHGTTGGGSRTAANDQDWRAKEVGLRDFRDLAIIRLAIRHRHAHDDGRADDAAYLKQRYNIPISEERIQTLITETRNRDRVNDALMQYGGSPIIDRNRARATR